MTTLMSGLVQENLVLGVECQGKAGELCQERGYEVIERDTDTGVLSSVSGSRGSIFGSTSTTVTRTMMIINNHLYKIKLSLRYSFTTFVEGSIAD